MGQPAAKKDDKVQADDIHIELVPVPAPVAHKFSGIINGELSSDVKIMGKSAATVGSTAANTPQHIPKQGNFQKPPTNKAKIQMGSATVKINGKAAARHGDIAMTCNDPADLPVGKVKAGGTVKIGG